MHFIVALCNNKKVLPLIEQCGLENNFRIKQLYNNCFLILMDEKINFVFDIINDYVNKNLTKFQKKMYSGGRSGGRIFDTLFFKIVSKQCLINNYKNIFISYEKNQKNGENIDCRYEIVNGYDYNDFWMKDFNNLIVTEISFQLSSGVLIFFSKSADITTSRSLSIKEEIEIYKLLILGLKD